MLINKKTGPFFTVFIIAVISIIIMITGGCGNSNAVQEEASSDNKTKEPVTYTIADTVGDWGFPAPYSHYLRGPGYVRMSFIFETLVWKDAEGLVGNLAESWEYDEEENFFTFYLRQDVKWHDGEKFTADDVLFTYDYVKKHPYAWANTGMIDRVETLDAYTLKIYLDEPFAPFLENVAGTLPIIPEHIYKSVENPQNFTDSKAAIGTGPFKLADYNKEQGTYLFEANYDYYLGEPLVDRIRSIKVGAQMLPSVVLNKTANVASIPPEMMQEFKDKNFSVLLQDHSSIVRLMFNHQKEPFSNKELRHAIAYAIDLENLVAISQRGNALTGSSGMLPPDNPWYSADINTYEFNPEKAKEILQQLGYTGLEISLLTKSNNARDAELIKFNLEKVGISVDIVSFDDKTVDNRINNWNFQLAINLHGGLGGDPQNLNKFISADDFNSARYYENKVLNELLARQVTIMDRFERQEVVAEIQKIYSEELPDIALYYPDAPYAHDGKVDLFFTPGGIAIGVPIPLNRLSFVSY